MGIVIKNPENIGRYFGYDVVSLEVDIVQTIIIVVYVPALYKMLNLKVIKKQKKQLLTIITIIILMIVVKKKRNKLLM